MITIKKSSRIGRYYQWIMCTVGSKYEFEIWKNLSLCYFVQSIFWRTLAMIAWGIFMLFMAVSMAFFMTYSIWVLIGVVPYDLGIHISSVVLILLVGFAYAAQLRHKYYKPWLKPEKPPSLVRLWLKAKKDKVCPIINVEE